MLKWRTSHKTKLLFGAATFSITTLNRTTLGMMECYGSLSKGTLLNAILLGVIIHNVYSWEDATTMSKMTLRRMTFCRMDCYGSLTCWMSLYWVSLWSKLWCPLSTRSQKKCFLFLKKTMICNFQFELKNISIFCRNGDEVGGKFNIILRKQTLGGSQRILKGEVSMYSWPPVWLVWNQMYNNWQFLFLFAKQTNPNQSNRR